MRFITFSCLLITLFTFSSCKTWTKEDWDKLKNRKFFFSEIVIYKKGLSKKESFGYMRKVPVFKILQLITAKYNITIDTSNYENFLSSGDYDKIKSFGILSDTTFTWTNPEKQSNRISIDYKMEADIASETISHSYKILIVSGDDVRARFFAGIAETSEMLSSTAGELGFNRVTSRDSYVFQDKETGKKVILSEKKLIPIKKEQKLKLSKSEMLIINTIDNYIKLLSPDENKSFRKNLFSTRKEDKLKMNKSEKLIINMIENYIKLLSPEERNAFKEKLIRYLDKRQ